VGQGDTTNSNRHTPIEVKCSNCFHIHTLKKRSLKSNINKYGAYLCLSCSMKKYHAANPYDENRRKKMSVTTKQLWTSKEYKNPLSKSLLNPEVREKSLKSLRSREYRQKASEISKLAWQSPERKSSSSLTAKLLWERDGFTENQILKQKIKWENKEYRQQQEISRKDPNYRHKISENTRAALADPGMRKKLSEFSKKRWDNPQYREKLGVALSKWREGKVSSLELAVHSILQSEGIEFKTQYPIDHYTFDIFVPQHNLLIEIQGEYWHGLDKMKHSDAAKFQKINEYFPNYKILYLYERDFMNRSIIRSKILFALSGQAIEPNIHEFIFNNVKIRELEVKDKLPNSNLSSPEVFLQSYHYAAYGRSAKTVYGAFINDKLIAVSKFASVVRKEVATSMEMSSSQVLELDRFCIHPEYQKKNFASWFLSRCSNLVFEKFPKATCLVSFSDSTQGHSGTIYKASNWTEHSAVKPDYHYISPEGFVIHKKTLYNQAVKMKMKEREYAEKFGYNKSFGREKTKFILMRK
jgi:very-short-patch-repair endonuclease